MLHASCVARGGAVGCTRDRNTSIAVVDFRFREPLAWVGGQKCAFTFSHHDDDFVEPFLSFLRLYNFL